MHWGGAPVDPTDPALPEGVQPLSALNHHSARRHVRR